MTPILVVHGINNHDRAAFEATVAKLSENLQRRTGQPWPMMPVFWGDMGGQLTPHIKDLLPHVASNKSVSPDKSLIARYLAGDSDTTQTRSLNPEISLIVQSALGHLSVPSKTRSGGSHRELEQPLRVAVAQELPKTEFLQFVGDVQLLQLVGEALGAATSPVAENDKSGKQVRGGLKNSVATIHGITAGVIRGFDAFVAKATGRILGNVNNELRAQGGPFLIQSLGDIMAYERNATEIQNRLWKTLAQHGYEDYGTREKPVNVIAHSLGGVMVFDAANRADNPLYIDRLITFGSQPAFFNVAVPRKVLATYQHGHPIALGETIGRWSNLFEPLDFLAFAASPVFSMAESENLTDKMIEHRTEFGFYTHSIYWQTEELQREIVDLMR